MTSNSSQSLHYEDEIDFQEVLKTIFASKKILISTLLFFSILSIIYSLTLIPSFKTSTKLEIGYFLMSNGDRELIESPSDVVSDLKVLLMKKPYNNFTQNVSMGSFENKIISLETTSSSAEQNENLLTEIINYLDERHSKLTLLITQQKQDKISHEIDLIETEISFNNSQNRLNLANVESEISLLKERTQVDLEAKIAKLKSDLPILDQEINQLNQVVIEDTKNLNLLKSTTLAIERAAISPTLEQIISSYKSQVNQLRRERNNSISEIRILSQKLDALKKNTFKSDVLFKLEEKKQALEDYSAQSNLLFNLGQRKKTLESQLKMLMRQTQIKTQPIGNIRTDTIKPKIVLTIFLGLIIGFIAGILLIYINNFIKSFRDSEA